LLLLRAAAGVAAMVEGIGSLSSLDERTPIVWIAGLIATASSLSLLLGLLTPAAGALVALTSIAVAAGALRPPLVVLRDPLSLAFLVIVALAIVLLGPGAYSLDAYFFGRREIVIPDAHARD
jgi:uncharacterized membrane protein YphA (DoxX/SURF4 family)